MERLDSSIGVLLVCCDIQDYTENWLNFSFNFPKQKKIDSSVNAFTQNASDNGERNVFLVCRNIQDYAEKWYISKIWNGQSRERIHAECFSLQGTWRARRAKRLLRTRTISAVRTYIHTKNNISADWNCFIYLPLSQRSPAQPPEQTQRLFTQAAPFWQFLVHLAKKKKEN